MIARSVLVFISEKSSHVDLFFLLLLFLVLSWGSLSGSGCSSGSGSTATSAWHRDEVFATSGLKLGKGSVSNGGEEGSESLVVDGDSAFLHEGSDGVLGWSFAGGEVQ